MWTPELKLNRSLRTASESCRTKDLWVTGFVPLPPPINKIALAFTSKEIGKSAFCNITCTRGVRYIQFKWGKAL